MSDMTGLWVFFKRHSSKVSLLITGLLLFSGGWMTGRAMSPYYASHPIVFEESKETAGGSPQALAQLRAEGQGQVAAAATSSPNPTSVASPIVAGAQTVQPTEPTASPASVTAKAFVGSKNSDLYHDPSCSSAKRIKEENQVWFSSREEAEKAGYSPSACTKEKLGI